MISLILVSSVYYNHAINEDVNCTDSIHIDT